MSLSVLHNPLSVSKPLLPTLLIAAALSAPAQAQPEQEIILEPLVVTASRIEQPQKEAIPHTTVITSEMIRNRQPSDLLQLLRNEAGLSIVQSGGSGTQASVFMRGANSNQILVLIDGIPVRDASMLGNPMQLQHVLPDQIERIEIVRGNVSAIYGSGAIGGVIQIFTKSGEGTPTVSATAEYGSDSTTRLNAGFSGNVDGTRFALSATRLKTDGFSAMSPVQNTTINPDDDGNRNVSFSGMLSREWSKEQEVGIRFYGFDAKSYYDNTFYGPTSTDWGTSKQWTVSGFSKNRLTSNWRSTATLSYTDLNREDFHYTPVTPASRDTEFKTQATTFQWDNEIVLSPGWKLTAGTDLQKEKGSNLGSYDETRKNYSIYAGINGRIDRHNIQANVRYDHVEDSGSDTTGYLGYGFDLTPSWRLIASASTAFAAPNLYQQYDTWSGDPNLNAERSRSYEAGIQYAEGVTLVRATFFDTRTRDMIDWVSIGGWTGKYFNVGRVKNRGFELTASTQLAGIDIRGSLTLQDPENRETHEQLSRRARKLASLDISRKIGAWHIGGNMHYEEHRPDDMNRLPSYVLFNLNARYQITKELAAFAKINNLLDRDYQTVYGYNRPDRQFFVGLNWKM